MFNLPGNFVILDKVGKEVFQQKKKLYYFYIRL